MRYGIVLNTLDMDTGIVTDLAVAAEQAGWDGIFLPDDYMTAWVRLAAIATRTERIRLGTMLTPLPEQDPWYVAAQAAVLDELSGGRVILAVGLGVLELDKFGLDDNGVRARWLDEGLTILDRWWAGERRRDFAHDGVHFRLQPMAADVAWTTHRLVQRPAIPVWVVGGKAGSQIRRAAKRDGAIVASDPDEIRERVAAVRALRDPGRPLDIIVEGETPADDPGRAADLVRPSAGAGATWWMESRWQVPAAHQARVIRERIEAGPLPL
ncbi:MAG TPA: LLM class flavin-dependent oxidoreductase [Thermomicrobiales bacterium]|jgi:alkanesulfonate monooxygenase SsuD/methylene tetrahydromethanopterin reductase-like flavin-dependent oxidoreductase (luciferase family)|nr:LLM class flavin-dependent oxidoreductase [Thermomicrobiales bacterium]